MLKTLFVFFILGAGLLLGACQKNDCSKFKEGKFYDVFNSDTIYISRYGNTQIEEYKGYLKEMDVEWTSPCSYILTTTSESNRDSLKVGRTFEQYRITILNTTESSYTYKTKSNGTDMDDISTLYLLR